MGTEKKDAWVACAVSFPIVKQTTTEDQGPELEGDVSWTADKKIDLPENIKSFTMALDVFNGRKYIVTDARTPTGFLSIRNGGSYLLLSRSPRLIFEKRVFRPTHGVVQAIVFPQHRLL